MKWSPQQDSGLSGVETWFKSHKKKQIFRLFGHAGTGKTTLAKHFASFIDGTVLFAAYTGKAALQLRKAGCENACTIHSLIYIAEEQPDGSAKFILNKNSPLKKAALLIVDECSMVDDKLAADIMKFGKPILVLGDPAQLPPIDGAGYFTNSEPDIMLTEIHRQALDNPIIYLATLVREGNALKVGDYGESSVLPKGKLSRAQVFESDQIISGRNATRTGLNTKARTYFEYEGLYPNIGEKLICLRNDKELSIFNGGMFRVLGYTNNESIVKPIAGKIMMRVQSEDDHIYPIQVKVRHELFNPDLPKPDFKLLKETQEFDFGYAITCHKSQGSQWGNTVIYDESWCFREQRINWLYTAITRAQDYTKVLV